jgi:hypothetical protein
MTSKIDEILNKAKKLDYDSPLISIDELKNSIEENESMQSHTPHRVNYYKKVLILSASFSLIIALIFLLNRFDLFENKKLAIGNISSSYNHSPMLSEDNNHLKNESIRTQVNPDNNPKISLNKNSNDAFETINHNSQLKSVDNIYESVQTNNIQTDEFQNQTQTDTSKYGDFESDADCFPNLQRLPSTSIMVPFTISGIKTLELTEKEWENLVPNMKINDTTFAFYDEYILSGEKLFNSLKLDTLGYKKENLPFLVRRYSEIHQGKVVNSKYLRCDDRQIKDYSRTQYIAYIGFGKDSYSNIWGFSNSPILKYSNNRFYNEYYDFIRAYGNSVSLSHYDSIENSKLRNQKREFEKKLINTLIPVKRLIFGRTFLFWFVPNNEFISSLPEQYREDLKNELTIYHRIIEGSIPAEAACKGIENDSYFEVCRINSGAIRNLDLNPNPANISTTCKFELMEPRRITISLHSLDGRYVKEIYSQVFNNLGEKTFSIDLSSLPKSIYLLAVSSEQAEQVVKKIIIE